MGADFSKSGPPDELGDILQSRLPLNRGLAQFFQDRLMAGGGSTQQFPVNRTTPQSPIQNAFLQSLSPVLGLNLSGSGVELPGTITPGNMSFLGGVNAPGTSTIGPSVTTQQVNPFTGMTIDPLVDPSFYGTPVFRQGLDPEADVFPGSNPPGFPGGPPVGGSGAGGGTGGRGGAGTGRAGTGDGGGGGGFDPREGRRGLLTSKSAISSSGGGVGGIELLDANPRQFSTAAVPSATAVNPNATFDPNGYPFGPAYQAAFAPDYVPRTETLNPQSSQQGLNTLGLDNTSQLIRFSDPLQRSQWDEFARQTGVLRSTIPGMSPGEWLSNVLRQQGFSGGSIQDAVGFYTNTLSPRSGQPANLDTSRILQATPQNVANPPQFTGSNTGSTGPTAPTGPTTPASSTGLPGAPFDPLSVITGSSIFGKSSPRQPGGTAVDPRSNREPVNRFRDPLSFKQGPRIQTAPGQTILPPPPSTGSRSEDSGGRNREILRNPTGQNFNQFDLLGNSPLFNQGGNALSSLLFSGNPISASGAFSDMARVLDQNARRDAANTLQSFLPGGLRSSSAAVRGVEDVTERLQAQKNSLLSELTRQSLESAESRRQNAINQLFGAGGTVESALQGRFGENLAAQGQQFQQQLGAGQFNLGTALAQSGLQGQGIQDILNRYGLLGSVGQQQTGAAQAAIDRSAQSFERTQNALLPFILSLATNTPFGTSSTGFGFKLA